MNRRLYRCRHDRKVAGVASGIAEYFDADPSIVRLFWVLSIFLGGAGVFLYIAMAIIVPLEPEEAPAPLSAGQAASLNASAGDVTVEVGDPTGQAGDATGQAAVPARSDWHSAPAMHRHASRGNGRGWSIVGMVLILFGALALIDGFLPAWADSGRFLWPAFVLGIGALLVLMSVRRETTDS